MDLKNAQSDLLLNDIAIGATTATLTGGNFGTPTTAIYLTFDYDVAAKYEVKLCTVAGAGITGMSHISGANVAHSAGCKVGRMINAEVIDDIVSGATLLTPLSDGWIKPTGTWTRASASSITVPSGAASLYSVGDKIKLTDTTVKYFSVTAVADTLLTVTGGTDYTLVGTISSYYYSKTSSPAGFPDWFAYTVTATPGGSMTYGTLTHNSKFKINGKSCVYQLAVDGTLGGSASNTIQFSLPVNTVTTQYHLGSAGLYTNSTTMIPCGVWNDIGVATITMRRYDSGNMTLAATQAFYANITYPI
jgi:hypothetical protein